MGLWKRWHFGILYRRCLPCPPPPPKACLTSTHSPYPPARVSKRRSRGGFKFGQDSVHVWNGSCSPRLLYGILDLEGEKWACSIIDSVNRPARRPFPNLGKIEHRPAQYHSKSRSSFIGVQNKDVCIMVHPVSRSLTGRITVQIPGPLKSPPAGR